MSCAVKSDHAIEQCEIEHKSLNHIKAAMCVTLNWRVPSVGIARKLSSVHFTFMSFRRHLERLMALEEEGGYMSIVREVKPHWCSRVEILRNEHDEFRVDLDKFTREIESLRPDDPEPLQATCQQVRALLRRVDRHDQCEGELLQEALTLDEGGEG